MKNKIFDWPEKRIPLQDLLLDSENHRLKIERDIQLKSQKDIIDNLIKNDDILSLAKQISKHGFVPVEKIIVLKKREKYIVLEGNRRLAALKCLINPDLAKKPGSIKSFKEMRKSLPVESIKQIPVFIAPNREEALKKFIIPKHTEPSIKKWSTYNKLKLYAKAVLDQGKTIDQVCSSYDTTKEKVSDALRMYQCYEVATKISLPEEVMKEVLDERKFPITTLDRLISYQKSKDFLGIRFDTNGNLKGKIKKEEFIKGYSRIVSDIALRKATSRTLDKDKDKDKYIRSFQQNEKPNLKKSGSFSFKSFKISTSNFKKERKGTTPKSIKNTLKDYDFIIHLKSEIISNAYKEIQLIDFYKKPYTFAMVFRAFLHMCCSQYARENDLLDKIKTYKETKDPTLKEILSYFSKKKSFNDNAIEGSIKDFINPKNNTNFTTIEILNELNHANTKVSFGAHHKRMLDTLEQFLRKLLKESNANS